MKKFHVCILSIFCLALIQCNESNFRAPEGRMKAESEPTDGYFKETSGEYGIDDDIDIGSVAGDVMTFTATDACSNSSYTSTGTFADVSNGLGVPVAQANNVNTPPKKTPPVKRAEDDPNLKLIKTAYLTFEVDSIEKTRYILEAELQKLGGFISTEKQSSSSYRNTVSMTLRLPKYYFNEMIAVCDAEGIKKFDQREIKAVDVSEEFVDLTARIKTKKELEKRYHQLLKKAKDVEEVINVEREIEKLRSEIEAKEGRLRFLGDRVSLSTIHLEFYKELPKEIIAEVMKPNRFSKAFLGGWNGLVSLFLGLIYIWPMLLFGAIVLFVLRRFFKNYKTVKA